MVAILCSLLALTPGLLDAEAIEARMRAAHARFVAGAPSEALEMLLALEDAVEAHGDDHRYRWALGRCHEALGDARAAAVAYAASAGLAPDAESRERALHAADLSGGSAGRSAGGVGERGPAKPPAAGVPSEAEDPPDAPRVQPGSRGPSIGGPSGAPPDASSDASASAPESMGGPGGAARAGSEIAAAPRAATWALGVGLGVGVGTLLGQAPGWTVSDGMGLSVDARLLREGHGWSLGFALGLRRQSFAYRYQEHVTYDVTLNALTLRALAAVDLLPRTGPGLVVGLGPGADILLDSEARATFAADSRPLASGFDALQPIVALEVGTWLSRGWGLRLDAGATFGVLPAGRGGGHAVYGGLGASWHH